jgi:streptogramin lyase
MRRAFRLVMGCLPTAVTFAAGVSAVFAVAALTALGSPHAASGAESSRGLHVISMGNLSPLAGVLADDATPWLTATKYDLIDTEPSLGHGADSLIHVAADGRVVRYDLPTSTNGYSLTRGADGALWAVDDVTNGLLRVTLDGRYTQYRDVWATRQTRDRDTSPASMILGPDGRFWLGYQNRILSVAADSPARVVATLGRRVYPEPFVTGLDGSVWFTAVRGDQDFSYGLQRVLPDGRLEAVRYPHTEIDGASVAPNGDVWFVRSKIVDQTIVKRTDLVRIDRTGRVTEFRAPRLAFALIAVAPDGTVWIAGLDGNGLRHGDLAGVLARMDETGFTRIYRAPGWLVDDIHPAPDGRLWLIYEHGATTSAAWLPPNPCLSRRRLTLHLHSRRGDPIRRVRRSVQGRLPRTFHGREPSIPIDLRGYLPGAVGVTLKIRTAHHRRTRHLVFHTCTS